MTRSGRLLLSILGAFALATAGVAGAAAAPVEPSASLPAAQAAAPDAAPAAPLEPSANLPAVQAAAADAAPAAGQVTTTQEPADCAPTTSAGKPCDPVGPTSETVSPNVAWTVTLSVASATAVPVGTNVTLTATANQDVGSSAFHIVLLNGSTVVGTPCGTGTTCTWTVTSPTATSVSYKAVIAHVDGSGIQATSSIIIVTWMATISGTVRNTSFVPLAGIWAEACAGSCAELQTGADGTYSLMVPSSATYSMFFSDPSGTYLTTYRNGVGVGTNPVTGIDATLILPWTVTLAASATSVSPGTPVTLTATANQEVGPTDYDIVLLNGSTVVTSCASGTTCTATVTSATPTSRSYRAVIAYEDGTGIQANSSTVTVVWMATISGTVRNGAAAGLAGITVYFCIPGCAGGPAYHTTTVSGGTYSIAVAPGSYTLLFSDGSNTYGSGWYSTSGFTYGQNSATPVNVTSSNASGIDITLPLAVHIKGKVTNAGGAGLLDITVSVYFPDAISCGSTSTLADGTYSFPVAPGSYLIKFSDVSKTYATGWYSTAGFTYAQTGASQISLTSSDATGKDVTLPLAGATYFPLTPTRLLDTRNGTGLSSTFSSHVARTFQVTGGAIPASATAVTGNLTVTQQTSAGFLYIGPVAANNPTSSTLNFPLGDDRANAVTVALSGTGTLSITYAASTLGPTAQVIFDVTGYFTPDASGATYHALTPSRILDSRDHTGGLGIFSSHGAQTFLVRGVGGVPASATAVTGNLTVTGQSSAGFLYIGPVGMANPTSSTLNFPLGDDRANAVTVALGGGGTLSVTYAAATLGPTAQVIFDVTGYFTPDMTGATYHTLTPTRLLDTRSNTGLSGPSSSHVARPFQVTGGVVLSGATAVTGNLTVTQQTTGGFLYIGPVAQNNPTSSTLNFPLGDDRANAVTVALGTGGTLSVTYAASTLGPTAQVIFDVTGYFAP